MSIWSNFRTHAENIVQEFTWKAIFTPLCSFFAWTVGGADQLLYYLFLLMVMDFIFGFWRAWTRSAFSSNKLKSGGVKFLLYWTIIVVAVTFDRVLAASTFDWKILEVVGVKIEIQVRSFVLGYLCLTEIVSILEHASFFGAPIPRWLLPKLRVYRENHMSLGTSSTKSVVDEQLEYIFRFDKHHRITFVNEAFSRFLGLSIKQLLTTSIFNYIPQNEQEGFLRNIRTLGDGRDVCTGDIIMTDGTNARRVVQSVFRAFFNSKGKPEEFLITGRDITLLMQGCFCNTEENGRVQCGVAENG